MTINLTGRVVHGDGYGKTLGFPTANLDRREYARKKMKVRLGVWGGKALVGIKIYKAAIVIGPMDNRWLPKIEAHLINFKGNLYGKKIGIILEIYLRPFKKFKTIRQLKKQIAWDVEKVKK